ncbi:hypothetical protein PHLGIDRAFT_111240 [Phlebiopsis gigantea 11061_1 CR5-6]|uniref:Major facilitator superfamily (MFS) profile domain-containing protein n=1 Tax=Phlebiopsis gigantea (strain 11061_1 CR5-6) TaxID=745531 RepID=A0A0C3RS63_PHLG1|nr:hypothetical protein PHLGIDRAFT_111240 [Phlebiopsis gigantea 11061_1 CR5-6]
MTGFSALPIAEGEHPDDTVQLIGTSKILGPRWLQLPVLTVGLLGVQVLWSVEMSYGTPYLISLGLSKSAVAMVFLAGPISGLVVQPLIGVLADSSKSRFGRRRPYMLAGVVICTFAMLLLGFTRPFATIFTSLGSTANNLLTVWLAIFAIFAVDFSINAVQAVDRALLVDTLPPSDQPDGNAWAARMLGVGSVAGYFIGNVDMTRVLPFLGKTELEVLSVVGSFLLVLTHAVTSYCTKEKVVLDTKQKKKGLVKEFKEIWINIKTLPTVIRQICIIQFFAWIGWFPLLFNTTEFIAELHRRSHPELAPEAAMEEGTRLGSRAMFYNAILSLVASIVLPLFAAETKSRRTLRNTLATAPQSVWVRWFNRLKIHLASLWAASHLLFAVCMAATFFYSTVWGATFFTTLAGFSWAVTQWAPFALLAEAILSDDGELDFEDASSIHLDDTRSRIAPDHERQFLVGADEEEEQEQEGLEDEVRSFRSSVSMDDEEQRPKLNSIMSNSSARMSHLDVPGAQSSRGFGDADGELSGAPREKTRGGLAAKAGIILGIHNIFIVMPQFVITGISSIIFALASGGENDPGDLGTNSTAVNIIPREGPAVKATGGPNLYAYVFRSVIYPILWDALIDLRLSLGGLAATVAFVLTVKLTRHIRQHGHA